MYKSNKLVYEDNQETNEILNQILEEKSSNLSYIGSDETGKGEWYGPLVVVGTCLNSNQIIQLRKMGVTDSKLLSSTRIKELAQTMFKMGLTYESRIISPEKYNALYAKFNSEGKSTSLTF